MINGYETRTYTYKVGTYNFAQDIVPDYREGIGLYNSDGGEYDTFIVKSNTCIEDGDITILYYEGEASSAQKSSNNTNSSSNVNNTNNTNATKKSESSSNSQNKLTPFEYDTSVNIKIPEGEYTREHSEPHTGKLKITNATGNSFDFSFECIYALNPISPHIGVLSGTAKAVKGNKFVFEDHNKENSYGYDYAAFFTISGEGDNIKITVTDECYDIKGNETMNPYAGMNVTFEGTYKK